MSSRRCEKSKQQEDEHSFSWIWMLTSLPTVVCFQLKAKHRRLRWTPIQYSFFFFHYLTGRGSWWDKTGQLSFCDWANQIWAPALLWVAESKEMPHTVSSNDDQHLARKHVKWNIFWKSNYKSSTWTKEYDTDYVYLRRRISDICAKKKSIIRFFAVVEVWTSFLLKDSSKAVAELCCHS